MVTSLNDVSNTVKENYPNLGIGQQPLNRSMKNTLHNNKIGTSLNERKKKLDKNKDQFSSLTVNEVEMDNAFDQLLVCVLVVNVQVGSSHS